MNVTGPSPYFQFAGTARQALEHWQGVFGGEVQIATYADFSRTDGPADAVAHGQLTGGLQQRPWGDWDGTVRDAFGVTWLIGFEASALG